MKNVLCAGGATADAFVWVGASGTCGWRGERYPAGVEMWNITVTAIGQRAELNPAWIDAATVKPCPRCGGKVKLAYPPVLIDDVAERDDMRGAGS